jgi:hypothetical protein
VRHSDPNTDLQKRRLVIGDTYHKPVVIPGTYSNTKEDRKVMSSTGSEKEYKFRLTPSRKDGCRYP